jgi:signal transduction histidine kinase
MRSLQTRLGTGLIVSLVLLFSLQWLIVIRSIRFMTENYIASRLEHDAETLLAALTAGAGAAGPVLNPEGLDSIFHRPFSGHYFLITSEGIRIRSRSLWDQDLPVPVVHPGEKNLSHLNGPQGQRLLMLTAGFKKLDRNFQVSVSEDLTPIEADIRQFQVRYGLLSLGILVVLILAQRTIVSSSLAPLNRARRDVADLEQGKISQLREDVPAEVKPLIREINRLLDAMSRRLARSRNAAGNLAHALKAPLTLLVQLADREELRAHPDLYGELQSQIAGIRDLLERELKRARLAGSPLPGQSLSLRDEVRHLLDALRRIYPEKPLEVETDLPAHRIVMGEREDMLELLGNLLDNAFKWAKSRISLRVGDRAGVWISIEDDGPGCPPDELERLSHRGVRLDESAAGHGLGLSIAKDILEQYSGRIGFGRSERLGGFKVWIQFPPNEP